MLEIIIIVALLAAFVILLIDKIGLRDIIIQNAPRLISKLFECDFCLSFWTSVVLTAVIVASTGCWSMAVTPIVSTPITRVLI